MPDPLSSAKPIMNRPGCCDDDEHSHHFDRRSPSPQQHSTGSSDSDSEMGKKRGPYICKECSAPECPVYLKGHICPYKKETIFYRKLKKVIFRKRSCQTVESFLYYKKTGIKCSKGLEPDTSGKTDSIDRIKFAATAYPKIWPAVTKR